MSCASCIWFNGDPEHEYGWCDTQQEATNKDYMCDFWKGSLREKPVYAPFCWLPDKVTVDLKTVLWKFGYEPTDEGEYE